MNESGPEKDTAFTEIDLKELFDNYFDPLRNYIYYSIGDDSQASDVAQECFIKLWSKKDSIRKKTVVAYLYRMATNLATSILRHRKVRLNYQSNFISHEKAVTPEEEAIYSETLQKYKRVLEEMPGDIRSVFLMSRVDNLKYSEIAERLNLSVKAIEKRMSKAIQILKSQLKAE